LALPVALEAEKADGNRLETELRSTGTDTVVQTSPGVPPEVFLVPGDGSLR